MPLVPKYINNNSIWSSDIQALLKFPKFFFNFLYVSIEVHMPFLYLFGSKTSLTQAFTSLLEMQPGYCLIEYANFNIL